MPVLWIDAVCINQAHTAEKNQQVFLMAQIYRSAFTVLDYLGESSLRADLAISLIGKIAETDFDPLEAQLQDMTFLPVLLPACDHDESWKALQYFWRRSWFRRVWVIQEFALGRNLKVVYGGYDPDWKIIKDAAEKINDNGLMARIYQLEKNVFKLLQASAGVDAMRDMCELRCQSEAFLWLEDRMLKPEVLEGFDKSTHAAIKNAIKPAIDYGVSLGRTNPDLLRIFPARLQDLDSIYLSFDSGDSIQTPRMFYEQPLIRLLQLIEMSQATDL